MIKIFVTHPAKELGISVQGHSYTVARPSPLEMVLLKGAKDAAVAKLLGGATRDDRALLDTVNTSGVERTILGKGFGVMKADGLGTELIHDLAVIALHFYTSDIGAADDIAAQANAKAA